MAMATTRRPANSEVEETAKDVALVWLIRRAYHHAAFFHAEANIEAAQLAPEVKAVLLDAVERAKS